MTPTNPPGARSLARTGRDAWSLGYADRLPLALALARFVTWDWDARTGRVVRSANAPDVVGLPADDPNGFESFTAAIHPADRPLFDAELERAVRTGDRFRAEFRLRRPDTHEELWIEERGQVFTDETGSLLGISGVTLDITERRRAEDEIRRLNRALSQHVAELDQLLDVLPVGIGIAEDPECRRIRINTMFSRILDIPKDRNASLSAPESERPNHLMVTRNGTPVPADELPLQRAARCGETIRDEEHEIVHADGRIVTLLQFAAPLFDDTGRIRGSVGAFLDITERRRGEDRLRELNHWLETIIEAAPLAIWIMDPHGRVTLWNAGAEKMFGWGRDEVIGRPPPTISEEQREEFSTNVARTFAGDFMAGEEVRRARKDGTTLDVSLWSAVLRDGAGRPTAVLAMAADITARREVERVNAQLAAIVESSEDAIIGLAPDGTVTSWNLGAERLFGYAPGEIVGTPVMRLSGSLGEDESRNIVRIARSGGRVENFETQRFRKDGSAVAVSLTLSPIRDPSGAVIGVSEIVRDISARASAERELRQAKETAEAANNAKDQFLAVLSHELRTPLAPVMALLSNMELADSAPPEFRRELAMIRRNVELEARLIDDLLDLTRIARGRLQLHRVELDVRQSIRDAMQASWTQDPVAKHLRLELDLAAADHLVFGDGPRLTQVFWNLFSNAIKFTPADGRVAIRTSNAGDRLRVRVEDTGIGIAPDALPGIFNAFDQGAAWVAREYGGLGLGLTISRSIVALHEGTLSVESAGPNAGSAFTVELPLASAAQRRSRPDSEVPVEGPRAGAVRETRLHILLVEDHADTAEAMSMLLDGMGYRVTVAGSVGEALATARETADLGLVISDLDLPDGSGLGLMKELSAAHGLRGIALSGFGMEDDVKRSREAGFERHLTKPINLQLLERAIADVAG